MEEKKVEKKKAGIFSKDFWVKGNEVEVIKTDKTTPSKPQTISGSVTASPTASVIIKTVKAGTDYGKVLDDALEAANQEGADFFEFSNAIASMKNGMIGDEFKYENAGVTFKALGATPEKLISSAEYYDGVLDGEAHKFTISWENAKKEQVDDKQAEMETLAQENVELNKKIQANNEKVQKLNEEAFAANNNLSNEKRGFENELNIRKSTIAERISKIKMYLLKPTTTK